MGIVVALVMAVIVSGIVMIIAFPVIGAIGDIGKTVNSEGYDRFHSVAMVIVIALIPLSFIVVFVWALS